MPPAPASRFSTPICAATRPPPGRCAPAWRCRAPPPPPKSCASTPTKRALRDLRFAVGDPLGPAAKLLSLWRDLAGRPPSLDPGRIRRRGGAARPGLSDPNGLAASLKACAGEGDPVSAAAKAAALAFSAFPDAPAGRSRNPRPLGVRHGHRHPAALAAARAADRDENSGPEPAVRRAERRPRPGDPAWPNAAAGAIALAAASALDLAADLSRRSETLIAVAPKLRAETGGRKSSTSCSPKIASRPPKRPATRR